jgi:hypothetical protein
VAEKNQETNSFLSGVDTASTSAGIPDGNLCRFDLALNVSRYLRGRAGDGCWFTGARDTYSACTAEGRGPEAPAAFQACTSVLIPCTAGAAFGQGLALCIRPDLSRPNLKGSNLCLTKDNPPLPVAVGSVFSE